MVARILSNGKLRLRNGLIALAVAGTIAAPPITPDPPIPTPPPQGDGTITVTASKFYRWTWQRVGTSKNVPVSGSSTAPAGALIEARVIDETTSAAVTTWATIGSVQADSTYAGTVNAPQGKWYRLQVRIVGSSTGIATELNSFGVGIWIAELGQSNMANNRTSFDRSPLGDPAAYEYYDGVYRRAGNISKKINGVDQYPPFWLRTADGAGYGSAFDTSGQAADGPVYMCNLVAQGTDLPVVHINRAVIGSLITQWNDTANPTSVWGKFVADLALAGGDCEFVIWLQGEYNIGMAKATYLAGLDTLYANLKTLTGRDASSLKFGMISLGPCTFEQGGDSDAKFGAMRATQVEWAYSRPGAFYAASAYDMYTGGDGIHLGGFSHGKMGRRYGKSILAQLGIGTTAAGPRMVSAAQSGSVFNVTFAHTGGTALQDGRGGAGTALRGFQLWDKDGAVVNITGTSITSATNVRLQADRVPPAPCTISYAMANEPIHPGVTIPSPAPYIDPDDAFCLVDDTPIYKTQIDDPKGCPAQPCAAITVTGG